MGQETSWGGNNHIGAHFKSLGLLVKARTIVSAIDGNTRHIVEIIAEALHGLVYLLGKFASRRHDDAIDGIVWETTIVKHAEYRQEIGCRLTCSCLGDTNKVAPVENLRNALFLDGSHFLEAHVIERVEDIIVEVCFFECHFSYFKLIMY